MRSGHAEMTSLVLIPSKTSSTHETQAKGWKAGARSVWKPRIQNKSLESSKQVFGGTPAFSTQGFLWLLIGPFLRISGPFLSEMLHPVCSPRVSRLLISHLPFSSEWLNVYRPGRLSAVLLLFFFLDVPRTEGSHSGASCRQLFVLRRRGKPCLVYVYDHCISTLQPMEKVLAMAAGAWRNTFHCIHSQETEAGKLPRAWLGFSMWYGLRPPNRNGLLTSMGMINIIPDSHAQRPISQVNLCAVKLTALTVPVLPASD